MKQDFFKTIKIVFIALLLTLGVNYLYAWTGPSVAPPGGNVAAPINVGGDQIKTGALTLGGLLVSGGSLFQGSVTIPTGAGVGKVLTSTDESGVASWQTPSGGSGGPIVVTEYGYYTRISKTSIGVHDYCALSSIATGAENHGARVWKESGIWYIASVNRVDVYPGYDEDEGQRFRVMCFDGNISGGVTQVPSFGSWQTFANNVTSFNSTQRVTTDGFLVVALVRCGGGEGCDSGISSLIGYSDSSASPTTVRGSDSSFTIPVKKNDYWRIFFGSGASDRVSIHWIPLQ